MALTKQPEAQASRSHFAERMASIINSAKTSGEVYAIYLGIKQILAATDADYRRGTMQEIMANTGRRIPDVIALLGNMQRPTLHTVASMQHVMMATQ